MRDSFLSCDPLIFIWKQGAVHYLNKKPDFCRSFIFRFLLQTGFVLQWWKEIKVYALSLIKLYDILYNFSFLFLKVMFLLDIVATWRCLPEIENDILSLSKSRVVNYHWHTNLVAIASKISNGLMIVNIYFHFFLKVSDFCYVDNFSFLILKLNGFPLNLLILYLDAFKRTFKSKLSLAVE